MKKECVLYEMKNICQADDLFKVVSEKTSLCCKYGQLLTVECRHNLKVLNVIVDLGRNVKTPLADECLALFQGREAGNAVVAMAATDREEFIGEMHGLGKEREYVSRFLVQGDFVIASQVLEQSLCADIMNRRKAMQEFLDASAQIYAVDAVDYGSFNIRNTDGMVVVEGKGAQRDRISIVPVADTVKLKRGEACSAYHAQFIERLMGKSMIFHGRMIGHGCRGGNRSGDLEFRGFWSRCTKIKNTIETAPQFSNEAARLVVE